MQIKMNQLLHYRNIWLGVAMIWICLFHSGLHVSSTLLNYIKMSGFGGVDICLFASGIGCYFSLEKDANSLRFWKRRLLRLAPTYLCFIIVWLIYKITVSHWPLRIVFGNLLGIQCFIEFEYGFNWYISALILFYLWSPCLKKVTDKVNNSVGQALIILLLLALSTLFWNTNVNVMFTRLPIFCMGMLFAKQCCREKQMQVKNLLWYAVTMLAGLLIYYGVNAFLPGEQLWAYGMQWYPFLLIAPGLCVMMSIACLTFEKRKIFRLIKTGLEWIGQNSFEIYLIHIFLFEILSPIIDSWATKIHINVLWLGTIPMIVIGCNFLKTVSKQILKIGDRFKMGT